MDVLALKIGLARALCAPPLGRLVARLFRDRVPFHGTVIDTSADEISAVTKAQLFWGLYEKAEVGYVRRYLRPDLDVVELGSSIGVMAAQVLRRQRPERRLVCVEAAANLRSAIERNSAGSARVTIVSAAVAYPDRPGSVVAFQRGASNIEGRIAHGTAAGVEVPTITLSRLLDEHHLDRYALICDIEGAEVGIIERDRSALARCQQLIIELHPTEWQGRAISVDDMVVALVDDHGFRLVDRHGPVCVFER
jgi:FkbM family methyltransferase